MGTLNIYVCYTGKNGIEKGKKVKDRRGEGKRYSKALPSLPVATSSCQSRRHFDMLDLSFLSPSADSIQDRKMSSSSGTKKEDRRESTVSKLAESEVM